MLRVIGGVIVGYIVMAIVGILTIVILWQIFGAERAFATDLNVASTPWAVGMIVGGFIAALVGGVVAALVGGPRRATAAKALAVVVLALGLISAIATLALKPKATLVIEDTATWTARPLAERIEMRDDGSIVRYWPRERGSMSFFEAGALAEQPTWYMFANPIVGLVGVLVGGSLIGRRDTGSSRDVYAAP